MSGSDSDQVLAFLIIATIVLAFYFIPAIVAFYRKHPNRWPILLINAVFGGTVIGWIGSLIWAFHAAHISNSGGSNGGESGVNLFVNDVSKVELISTNNINLNAENQLIRLKELLDKGAINQSEYDSLKARELQRMLT